MSLVATSTVPSRDAAPTARRVHVRWLLALVVACGAIIVFFPFFWMAVTSLKTAPEIQRVPLQIAPDHWLNFSNYIEVFSDVTLSGERLGTLFLQSDMQRWTARARP